MKQIRSLLNQIGGIVSMNGFEIDYDRMNGKFLFVRTTAAKIQVVSQHQEMHLNV